IKIGGRLIGVVPVAVGCAQRLRDRLLEPARAIAGGDVGEQVGRLLAAGRETPGEAHPGGDECSDGRANPHHHSMAKPRMSRSSSRWYKSDCSFLAKTGKQAEQRAPTKE